MIGDFWNVHKYHPEPLFNDNKGVSIAIAVTEKGEVALSGIKKYGKMELIPVEEIEMTKSHDCILNSAPQNRLRKCFYALNRSGFPLKWNVWFCLMLSDTPKKIYNKMKSLVRKII